MNTRETAEGIKIGDVVMLKSGGPEMTVLFVEPTVANDTDVARCSWFDGQVRKKDNFIVATLKLVKRN